MIDEWCHPSWARKKCWNLFWGKVSCSWLPKHHSHDRKNISYISCVTLGDIHKLWLNIWEIFIHSPTQDCIICSNQLQLTRLPLPFALQSNAINSLAKKAKWWEAELFQNFENLINIKILKLLILKWRKILILTQILILKSALDFDIYIERNIAKFWAYT